MPFPLLALHERLHVFDRPRTYVVEARGVRASFMGFPYTHDVRRRFPDSLAALNREGLQADVRVLCLHQCIEGSTCGPGNFTFRFGPDVIRTADLPRDVAVILSGHIHRHQVRQMAGLPPIIYAGSIERTSFAEAPETKGFVVLELARSGLRSFQFRPLPTRTMVTRTVPLLTLTRRRFTAVWPLRSSQLPRTPSCSFGSRARCRRPLRPRPCARLRVRAR